jgi:hypothetical protein
MRAGLVWTVCLPILVTACAGAHAQAFPVGTQTLAQVAHVATKDEMARGVTVDGTSLLVPPYLLKRCALDAASLETGDLAVMRVFVSWSSRGPNSSLWWVMVPKGLSVAPGEFVEVELKAGGGDERCPAIARVRPPTPAAGECGYTRDGRVGEDAPLAPFPDTVQALRESGASGSASIYCKRLEEQGWIAQPAGPNNALIWRRPPKAAYADGPDSRIERNGIALLPPAGKGWTVAPAGQHGAGWGKLLSDAKGNRSTVTLMMWAGQFKDRKFDLTTPAGLRAAAEWQASSDDRFRVIDASYSDVYPKHGTDCIDFNYTAEERGNAMPWNQGQVLMLMVEGTLCRHPSNREWSYTAALSDRHPKQSESLLDANVKAEAKRCLDSVELTALK